MKGANHLVPIAVALRDLGVPFEFTIYGDGKLASAVEQELRVAGLPNVKMTGVIDFTTELVPAIKQTDLFICTHVQGDPSCTYMETFACGVPIVGFDNEAFRGLAQSNDIGWRIPIGDVKSAARTIARLHRDRAEIETASKNALALARGNTLESTMGARVAHLRKCMSTQVARTEVATMTLLDMPIARLDPDNEDPSLIDTDLNPEAPR